uniref:Tethering factor for nuclear proteasome STS1 n=1 Tax=Blastobotrys adeninivorans TaxID=409370 RepID=A0A060TCY1_BLAAD
MVVGAVLPPSTGWGFEFTPTKSRTPMKNSGAMAMASSSEARMSQKRKNSSPDRIEVDSCSEDEAPRSSAFTNDTLDSFNSSFQQKLATSPRQDSPFVHHRTFATPTASRVNKRTRLQVSGAKNLPIMRVLETLDHKGLKDLVQTVCDTHPELADQISSLAPRVTVDSALSILKRYLDNVFACMPYSRQSDDYRGDYAYLRVRPAIDEFLYALSDYTAHFLPPKEQQPSNTLAFLDGATELLHRLPVWLTPVNNYHRNLAYEELAGAWVVAIKEASKKANGLALAHGGWDQRLDRHNQAEGHGRLENAVECIRQELAWLGNNNNEVPKDAYFYDLKRENSLTPSGPKAATIWE